MHEKMLAAVVTRKWQLAQGYLAIEIETKYPTQLPPFDDGAIVDLVRHTSSNIVPIPCGAFLLVTTRSSSVSGNGSRKSQSSRNRDFPGTREMRFASESREVPLS